MNRGVLITMTVVLGLAIVGIGYLLFRSDLANVNNANQTTNAPSNVNGTGVLTNVPVAKDATYRDGTIPIDRVVRSTSVGGFQAKKGEVFLTVYLKESVSTFDPPMAEWLARDLNLYDSGGNRYSVAYAYLTAEEGGGKEPFFAFRVPEPAEDFLLRFVRVGEDVKIDLGI